MINHLTSDLDKLREQANHTQEKVKPLEGLDRVVADLKNSLVNSNSFDINDLNALKS